MPDLSVHRGNGDYDREVANCKFPDFTNNYEVNLFQEANNKSSLVQTHMTSNGRFTATVSVTNTTGATRSAQRSFIWKRSSSFVLIDEETGETIAGMHGMVFGPNKCFVLETPVPYSSGFEVLVVTTAMVIYESMRRGQSQRSATHHGHGMTAQAAAASNAGVMGAIGAMGAIGGAGA